MAKPTPTPSQITAIQETVAGQQNMQDSLNQTAALQAPEIARATEVDNAFKSLFDWYNDNIIGKYDSEKRAINGIYVTSPIVEADILGVGANPPSGRLVPNPPIQDIVRVPEFDGGNTSTDNNNEQQHILDQANLESALVSGFGPSGPYSGTLTTTTALNSLSTTLTITDTSSISISVGSTFVITDVSDFAYVS